MFVNDQHSTVTLYRDKVACCLSSSSLPFITNVNLIVNAKALTVFSTYFKDVIQYSVRCPLKTRYLNSCYTMECCHSFLIILDIGSTFFFNGRSVSACVFIFLGITIAIF